MPSAKDGCYHVSSPLLIMAWNFCLHMLHSHQYLGGYLEVPSLRFQSYQYSLVYSSYVIDSQSTSNQYQ